AGHASQLDRLHESGVELRRIGFKVGGRYLQKSPSQAGEFTGRDARIAPGNSTAAKGFVPPVASASGRTFRFERSTKANEVNEGDAGGRTLLPHARSRLCLCAETLHPGSRRPFLTATPLLAKAVFIE